MRNVVRAMPKGIKNQSKIDAKMMLEKNMRTILKMHPNWSQNEPKWKLKCIQNAKKDPEGSIRVAKVRPKVREGKESKKRCQKGSPGRIGARGGEVHRALRGGPLKGGTSALGTSSLGP